MNVNGDIKASTKAIKLFTLNMCAWSSLLQTYNLHAVWKYLHLYIVIGINSTTYCESIYNDLIKSKYLPKNHFFKAVKLYQDEI